MSTAGTLNQIPFEDLKAEQPSVAEPEKKEVRQPRSGAEYVALQLEFIKPEEVIGDPIKLAGGRLLPVIRGRKALVGQYVVKGVDQSELINAHVKGAIRLDRIKPQGFTL